MGYLILALASCLILCAVHFAFRPKQISLVDSFLFFFLLQYGPHSLFVTPLSEFAGRTSSDSERYYLLGMTLTYLCLAAVITAYGFLLRDSDPAVQVIRVGDRGILMPVLLAAGYVLFFAALQGKSLEITREYVRGFSGSSVFEYTELRRELFDDTLYVRIASLTRQTTTALLFSWLMSRVRPFRFESLIVLGAAGVLFVICAMQMNKFPFAYFLTLAAISLVRDVVPGDRPTSGRLLRWLLPCAAIACVGLLFVLYRIQYRGSGLSEDRLNKVVVYRVLFCSADTLRLWFDYFPVSHPFLGAQGIPVLANMMDIEPVNATRLIPENYVPGVDTTFQVGFIGSGFATMGYWGIAAYSTFVAVFVLTANHFMNRDQYAAWAPFWNVLLLNMLFFTTRELHTALLSGGTVSVFLLMWICRSMPRVQL
ncbi:MAG: hypothetical protein JNM43_19370 [Planctomycetaceae bacterium]|nr:hypothetical protein [Planctomycetaceae bacterium]